MLRIVQLNKFNFKNKESAWCCERGLNSRTSSVEESCKLSNSLIIKAIFGYFLMEVGQGELTK